MGILAKRKTKQRVEPVVGEFAAATMFRPDQPWETHEGVVAAAAIRGAILGVGTGGTSSTTASSNSLFTSWSVSSLWCWWTDKNNCRIALGVGLPDDGTISPDWVMDVFVGKNTVVETPNYKTLSDDLVNGDLYDRLRGRVMDALASGGGNTEAFENAATAEALALPVSLTPAATHSGDFTFSIRTVAEQSAVDLALRELPCRKTIDADWWCWDLGMPGSNVGDQVFVTRSPTQDGAYRGQIRISGLGSPLHRRLVHRDAKTWVNDAPRVLGDADESSAIDTAALPAWMVE